MSVVKGVEIVRVSNKFPVQPGSQAERFNNGLKSELRALDIGKLPQAYLEHVKVLLSKTVPFGPNEVRQANNLKQAEYKVSAFLASLDLLESELKGENPDKVFTALNRRLDEPDIYRWLTDDDKRVASIKTRITDAFYGAFDALQDNQQTLIDKIKTHKHDNRNADPRSGTGFLVGILKDIAFHIGF